MLLVPLEWRNLIEQDERVVDAGKDFDAITVLHCMYLREPDGVLDAR